MKPIVRVASFLLVFSGFLTITAFAQPDVSGTWALQTTAQLSDENEPCLFSGTARVVQVGSRINGPAQLFLDSGPAACPAEMMAQLTGTVGPQGLSGTLNGGDLFGVASFQGQVNAGGVSLQGTIEFQRRAGAGPAPGGGATGGFSVTSGPFSGGMGTWDAQLTEVMGIPVLTAAGVAFLTALILLSTIWLLRRTAG